MLQSFALTPDRLPALKPVYEQFCARATANYRWDFAPVDWQTFTQVVSQGLLSGWVVQDTASPTPEGFMLYRLEDHGAVEINVIHWQNYEHWQTPLDVLMRGFLNHLKTVDGWSVVSYAMLGVQECMIRSIPWYGFVPVGQAILKFSLQDTIALEILAKQQQPALRQGYSLALWNDGADGQDDYTNGVVQTVYEAFCTAPDAHWDPRFTTLQGAREVVRFITSGAMGPFLPECTSVLLHNTQESAQPVGFCFLIQSSDATANVPLVGIRPSVKRKGFGKQLLKHTLDAAMRQMATKRLNLYEISATMETDNFPAIQMYRRMGFQEEYHYPHVYLERNRLLNMEVGKWC